MFVLKHSFRFEFRPPGRMEQKPRRKPTPLSASALMQSSELIFLQFTQKCILIFRLNRKVSINVTDRSSNRPIFSGRILTRSGVGC